MSIEFGGENRASTAGIETRDVEQTSGSKLGSSLRNTALAKIIGDRSFAHFRVDIAVRLKRLKDETYGNDIRFLMDAV